MLLIVVVLPPAERQLVRADMIEYANPMAGQEWTTMKRGSFDAAAAIGGMDATGATGTFVPANAAASDPQNATMQQLTIIRRRASVVWRSMTAATRGGS